MFAAIFLLAFLGLGANWVLVVLQRRLCRWSTAHH
jgi:sulfonate transport system permease protein